MICVYSKVDKAAYLPHPPPQLFYQSGNSNELASHTVKHCSCHTMINIFNENTDYYRSIAVVAFSRKQGYLTFYNTASGIGLIPLLIRVIIKPHIGHYTKCCLWYNNYNSRVHLGTGYDIMRSSSRLKH